MNALTIALPSPRQAQHTPESFVSESFVSRAADVNRLIDEKARLVMQSARLRAFIKSSPEQGERCLALICELEGKINQLQQQIDRELKGLFYGLQKAPAPSPFLDELPG